MPDPTLHPLQTLRKGIHVHFDARQAMIGDERWQIAGTGSNYLQFDSETTRPRPFPEPRVDSLTYALAQNGVGAWSPDLLTARASRTRREGRITWAEVDGDLRAFLCWQHADVVRRLEASWTPDTELGFRSPFALTALLTRRSGRAWKRFQAELIWLSTLGFEPSRVHLDVERLGPASRETHFGQRPLQGYRLRASHYTDEEAGSLFTGEAWCDAEGIAHDWQADRGDRIRLTAVTQP